MTRPRANRSRYPWLLPVLLILSPGESIHGFQVSPPAQEPLPTVVVLSTGGTIASTRATEAEGYQSSLRGDQLVAAVPGLDRVATIEVQDVANFRMWRTWGAPT
jgi:L-asparaginase/Glu-tRNA(Gln) amidotransferase subunit D